MAISGAVSRCRCLVILAYAAGLEAAGGPPVDITPTPLDLKLRSLIPGT